MSIVRNEWKEKFMFRSESMRKPNLQEYFKQCQDRGIFDHHVGATDNGHNVLFYIHPQNEDGEILDFEVVDNELTQQNVSEEENVRNAVQSIVDGLSVEELKKIANQYGLNYQ